MGLIPKPQLSSELVANLRERRVRGIVGINRFQATFFDLENDPDKPIEQHPTVNLTSAGVWIIVQDNYAHDERALFVQQNDRMLDDGRHPWEIASGRVNRDLDQSIYDTAVREVNEETGVRLTQSDLRPLAVGIKYSNAEYPTYFDPMGISDAVWVNADLLKGDNIQGGLIFLTVIGSNRVPHPFYQHNCRRHPYNSILLDPPDGVDRSEINKIAYVPVDLILSGSDDLSRSSANVWAQAAGLKAFLASASPL